MGCPPKTKMKSGPRIAAIPAIFLIVFAAGASAEFQPVFNPYLEINKSKAAIEIDGDPGDPGWKNVSRAPNFQFRINC